MSFGSWDATLFFVLNSLAGQSALLNALIVFTASYLPFILGGMFLAYLYCSNLSRSNQIRAAVLAFGAALIARGIGSIIRYFSPRPRPFITYQVHQLIAETAPSFPSGHALFFFAFSTIVFAYNRKLGIISFILTIIICIARVAAGIHYPSDILAGAVIGVLTGIALLAVVKKWRS